MHFTFIKVKSIAKNKYMGIYFFRRVYFFKKKVVFWIMPTAYDLQLLSILPLEQEVP